MNNLAPTLIDVSNKGQILIPSAIRRVMGIKPNGKVLLCPLIKNKQLLIEPLADDPIEAACGMFADSKKENWSKELVYERKKDLKKEEKDL